MSKIPLVLMYGPQASGKSSFIKMNNLENYTLSADDIRVHLNGIKQVGCQKQVNFVLENEKNVWHIFDLMLKTRLKNGLPTVIDNTNLGGGRINPLAAILQMVPDDYQVYLIDCFKPLLNQKEPLSADSLQHAYAILEKRNHDREYAVNDQLIQKFIDYYVNFTIPDQVEVMTSADLQQTQDLIDQILSY